MTRPEGKDVNTWPKCSFFAIYDGHGGSNCADYLKDNLHTIIVK
jgi:protein phosphatase 2C family protein 2/3